MTRVGAGRVLHAFPDEFLFAGPQPPARVGLAAVAGVHGYPRPLLS